MVHLTWEARNGIVHAVVEDYDGYAPPRALILACMVREIFLQGNPAAFGHVFSTEIRRANLRRPITCLLCIAAARDCTVNL